MRVSYKELRLYSVYNLTVVTPKPTRAGDASLLNQKDTQDIDTISIDLNKI